MPIGMTPREDELALIESLARNQGQPSAINRENDFTPLKDTHAHAIESKYGNFDFPTIPEHDTGA